MTDDMPTSIQPDNPFPGMNPFLEHSWGGVHTALLVRIQDVLAEKLPLGLLARPEEGVMLEIDDDDEWNDGSPSRYRVDLGISEEWKQGLPPVWRPDGEKEAVLAEPLVIERVDEPETQRWLEIRESGGRLVTIIEVLSPTNKGSKHEAYRERRRRFQSSGVNVVEIDLLRAGGHAVAAQDYACRWKDGTVPDYLVCVWRAVRPKKFEVYRWRLRERLPCFRVPLRPADPDVALDLQPLIDTIHRTGRYYMLDYAKSLTPELSAEDKAWVTDQLKAAGLRSDPTAETRP
jgi:hypothetical protein